jgi:hypothetical protein
MMGFGELFIKLFEDRAEETEQIQVPFYGW